MPNLRDPDDELAELSAQGLRRTVRHLEGGQGARVRIGGREVVNFSSNDYLGLASDPGIREAAEAALREFGAGAGASRLICGGLPPHAELEREAAGFFGTEAALSFANGYAAAVGTLGAVLRKGDVVILDKLAHACLIDGARLSGATLRVFPHNYIDKLRRLLDRARETVDPEDGRILIVTEAVFSMDGDLADLEAIAEAKAGSGALLLLDEAHALGVLGPGGGGLAACLGLGSAVDLRMGTLGKAAGAAGGIVGGSGPLIDLVRNRARSFIYSTAPPPAQAAAAAEGLRVLRSGRGEELRGRLRERVEQMREGLGDRLGGGREGRGRPARTALEEGREADAPRTGGTPIPPSSPIIPVHVGDEREAVALSERLLEEGFLCPAVRYPTVARGAARLRVTLGAAHEPDEVEALVAHLRRALP